MTGSGWIVQKIHRSRFLAPVFPVMVVLLVAFSGHSVVYGDTLSTAATVTVDSNAAETFPDSVYQDTLISIDTVLPEPSGSAVVSVLPDDSVNGGTMKVDLTAEDTALIHDGGYVSAGIGWSLGSFTFMDYWEKSLPDSLEGFGLSDTSFRLFVATGSEVEQGSNATADLKYLIKEQPSTYTMSFPLHLSFITISGTRRLSVSFTGSWMRKIYAASIGFTGDSTGAKCNYRESLNFYSLFIAATYGTEIPREYFAIEGVERCFFVCGFDIAPLLVSRITSSASVSSANERLEHVKEYIEFGDRLLRGGAVALHCGLSMLKSIGGKNIVDIGIHYTIQGYGRFFEDGNRVSFDEIDITGEAGTRPLYWISNRFGISMSLVRHREK